MCSPVLLLWPTSRTCELTISRILCVLHTYVQDAFTHVRVYANYIHMYSMYVCLYVRMYKTYTMCVHVLYICNT